MSCRSLVTARASFADCTSPDELLRLARRGGELRVLPENLLPRLGLVHRRVVRVGPFDLTLQLLHDVVVPNDVVRLHAEDRVLSQELIGLRVVDAIGMKLQIDPLVDAHAADSLGVAGAGAEGEPVERLLDLLVGQKLLRLARDRRGGRGVRLVSTPGRRMPRPQTATQRRY